MAIPEGDQEKRRVSHRPPHTRIRDSHFGPPTRASIRFEGTSKIVSADHRRGVRRSVSGRGQRRQTVSIGVITTENGAHARKKMPDPIP